MCSWVMVGQGSCVHVGCACCSRYGVELRLQAVLYGCGPCSVLHWFSGFLPGASIWFVPGFAGVSTRNATSYALHASAAACCFRCCSSWVVAVPHSVFSSFLLLSTAVVLSYATAGLCPGIGSCLKYTAGRSHLAVTYIHGHLTCLNFAHVEFAAGIAYPVAAAAAAALMVVQAL